VEQGISLVGRESDRGRIRAHWSLRLSLIRMRPLMGPFLFLLLLLLMSSGLACEFNRVKALIVGVGGTARQA